MEFGSPPQFIWVVLLSELFLLSNHKHIHIHFGREIHLGNVVPVSGTDRCIEAGSAKINILVFCLENEVDG